MGRGRGGYSSKEVSYRDSANRVVKDKGAIFVGEKYIDAGYEVVFRRERQSQKSHDLTIKDSSDTKIIKNIEVKQVVSDNPSKLATNIKNAFEQVKGTKNATVAIYLPYKLNSSSTNEFIQKGFNEALRKNNVHGKIEIWFKDGNKKVLN